MASEYVKGAVPVTKDNELGYGYGPKVKTVVPTNKDILVQRVDTLNIKALLRAINNMV